MQALLGEPDEAIGSPIGSPADAEDQTDTGAEH
jgi:hypothetical protein